MAAPATVPVSSSGVTLIDVMLNGGKWQSNILSWATADNPYQGYFWSDPFASATLIAPMIQQFTNVANISIAYRGHFADFTKSTADITANFSDESFFGSVDVLGRAIFPLVTTGNQLLTQIGSNRIDYPQPEGDIAISATSTIFQNPVPGTAGFYAALHEIGHALGLKHPHDGGAAGFATFSQAGIGAYDNSVFTVMSYNRPFAGVYASTLGVLDIAALQYLYGANTSYRTGGDTYALKNDSTIQTYWDAGGVDTFDASALTSPVSIDLLPGNISSTNNSIYSIALGAIIENAWGGTGADVIRGNSVSNILLGNDGNDTLSGDAGNDLLDGGAGNDVMAGGAGDDIMIVGAGDVVNESAGQGDDTVVTTLTSLTLANFSNVEHIVYITDGPQVLLGDGGANALVGANQNDYFYAYDGSDRAYGRGGVDVFVLGAGDDTAYGGADQDYIYGESGDDTLSGDGGVDVLLGGAGNDVMNGGTEGDYFYGEDGNDTGSGGDGNDIFVMTAGNDIAYGDDGQDYFYMGDGDDVMNGGAGVDVMLGEAGNDTFNGGLGVDYLFLGPQGAGDNDTVIVDKVNTGVQVVFGFEAGGTNDVIRLVGSGLTTFQQVQANISDYTASGGFCILTLDADTAVWFIGVAPSQLTSADFVFG